MLYSVHFAHCDTKGCDDSGIESRPAQSRKEMLAEMLEHGWTKRGRKTYCPDCSKAKTSENSDASR